MEEERYDYAIVGSGLGGLLTGALLASAGARVGIIEKHYHPGGYAHSFKRGRYWFCAGLLQGKMFGDPNWLGKVTEWSGHSKQTVFNPITRVYTSGGIRRLFAAFGDVTLRKGEFYFYLIPKIGRLYRRYQIRKYGEHPGGILVYGSPWPIQSRLELFLGRIMGFAWFIRATKPNQ